MPEKIILINGQPGSGKSHIVKRLWEERDITPVRPSLMIREYAAAHDVHLGADRSEWAEMTRRMGLEMGQDWIAQRILASPQDIIAVDGLRRLVDYNRLQGAVESGETAIASVGLFCPVEIRYAHVREGDFDKTKPLDQTDFFAQEAKEYFSNEGESGVATQTILDLTPPELRIEYNHESAEFVYQTAVSRLIQYGFLD